MITSLICFALYVIGHAHMCGRRAFDVPTIVGMAIVAAIPYLNVLVAAIIMVRFVWRTGADVYDALRPTNDR